MCIVPEDFGFYEGCHVGFDCDEFNFGFFGYLGDGLGDFFEEAFVFEVDVEAVDEDKVGNLFFVFEVGVEGVYSSGEEGCGIFGFWGVFLDSFGGYLYFFETDVPVL